GVLIFGGVAGFGVIADRAPLALAVMRWGGVTFLFAYGLRSLRAAFQGNDALQTGGRAEQSLRTALVTTAILTWANPHVYLDTLGLIGAVSATYDDGRWMFGFGALTASCVFFAILGYGARLLAPFFAKPKAWAWLDGIVGITMLALAVKLALGA
ncbi:MAG: LysE family transporter, partial [Pseudomonadota bacterium]